MAHGTNYQYESGSRYRIDNYDEMPGFCSFLPGIAGRDGVPLWCMYVNRAQAVVSFGVQDKDHAIAEFLPATWAYQLVGIQGFRTFCMIDGRYYEPFQRDAASRDHDLARTMWVESDRVVIQELNKSLGLTLRVKYFAAVNRPVAALVRELTISSEADRPNNLGVLDGLPLVIPAGFSDFGIKKMRHINEAYASARLIGPGVPFYSSKVQTHDEAEVVEVQDGNFYAAWIEQGATFDPVEPIVDPDVVFGNANDLVTPRRFIENGVIDMAAQVWENRMPCALVPIDVRLEPGQSITLHAVAGAAMNETTATTFISSLNTPSDFERMAADSAALIKNVTSPAFMVSANATLDAYVRQNYLDNVLRGGIPVMMPSTSGPTPVHLYSRRHGDLERDYNDFVLAPHPLSDGAGNYRDICQNRRHDCWFNPDLFDEEIRMFLQLLQADGFNPLGITGYRWQLPEETDGSSLCPAQNDEARRAFTRLVQSPFSPGQLLGWANEHQVQIDDRTEWIRSLLAQCDRSLVAGGHDGGYWIDHWTYLVDMLDSFAGIWPDRVVEMLTDRADIGWFDECAYVLPRRDKHVMRPGGPLQLNAVVDVQDTTSPLPPVTPLGKLCALLAVKSVSLDYDGTGIEMEAGRPGWNDSMNGLPGLFGSSTCETAEAARLATWLLNEVPDPPDTELPVEVAEFVDEVIVDLARPQYDWARAATIREKFRARVRYNASGTTKTVPGAKITDLLQTVDRRMRLGLEAAVCDDTQLVHTYFRATRVDAEPTYDDAGTERIDPISGSPLLNVRRLELDPLPLFLEGQVHRLRLLHNDTETARRVYHSVRASDLFDKPLDMYKLNECLDAMPKEIGRARTFSRGWFENESVWLHMSYKYLLELLRCRLYGEFFRDASTMLVPFMDPAVYGRSVLENCSFIACSDCPDPNARGRGFIARLSGSTAEFIHIWILLTTGERPFAVVDDALRVELHPILPGSWFTRKPRTVTWHNDTIEIPADTVACSFLGDILLVYHNPALGDTFGPSAVTPHRYAIDLGQPVERKYIDADTAERIRQHKCRRIDVWLG